MICNFTLNHQESVNIGCYSFRCTLNEE